MDVWIEYERKSYTYGVYEGAEMNLLFVVGMAERFSRCLFIGRENSAGEKCRFNCTEVYLWW